MQFYRNRVTQSHPQIAHLCDYISVKTAILDVLLISYKFVKGFLAIIFLLLVISCWNFHNVCQHFLYNQERNFSWIRQKMRNFPIDLHDKIAHFCNVMSIDMTLQKWAIFIMGVYEENLCLLSDQAETLFLVRPNKKICLFRVTVWKKLGRVGRCVFFIYFFILKKCVQIFRFYWFFSIFKIFFSKS